MREKRLACMSSAELHCIGGGGGGGTAVCVCAQKRWTGLPPLIEYRCLGALHKIMAFFKPIHTVQYISKQDSLPIPNGSKLALLLIFFR